MACTHERPIGATRCKDCHTAYQREWRKTAQSIDVRNAERNGIATGLHLARLELLKAGDREMSGFTAAELIRKLGLD